MTIRLYARFSPRRDANECESCETQLRELKSWAAANHPGVPIVEYSDKNASGRTRKRKDFDRMLTEIEKGDIVAVRNLERFARSLEVQIVGMSTIRRTKATLYSLESGFVENEADPYAKFLAMVLAAKAECDREVSAIRTQRAMQAKSLRGEYTGGRAQYGFKKTRDGFRFTERGTQVPKYKQVPVESQQACIAFVINRHAEGATVDQIFDELKKEWRHAQPENSTFSKQLISRIIDRENKRL